MRRKSTPHQDAGPLPDSADALAGVVWQLHDKAVRTGDLPTALRAARTLAELKGWTAATVKRKPKFRDEKELAAELAQLERELEIS